MVSWCIMERRCGFCTYEGMCLEGVWDVVKWVWLFRKPLSCVNFRDNKKVDEGLEGRKRTRKAWCMYTTVWMKNKRVFHGRCFEIVVEAAFLFVEIKCAYLGITCSEDSFYILAMISREWVFKIILFELIFACSFSRACICHAGGSIIDGLT